MIFYLLDANKNVVQCTEEEFNAFFKELSNTVVKQEMFGDIKVSTVFLGIDCSPFGFTPPLIFETMIFGGEHDDYQERYGTWNEALEGHQRAVELVKGESNEV